MTPSSAPRCRTPPSCSPPSTGSRATCRAALATEDDIDWGAERTPNRHPGSAPETITAGWTLLHALDHLREHVAHLQLTRQLWDARGE